jgi:hypothetical protein
MVESRNFRKMYSIVVLLLISFLVLATNERASADGAWLSPSRPTNWNTPGMLPPVPLSNEHGFSNDYCLRYIRSPETADDYTLTDSGWILSGNIISGRGIKLVFAVSYFDGMCRSGGYQVFAFVNEVLAGTVSPFPMSARFDASAVDWGIDFDRTIWVDFVRYSDRDPLCCPSFRTKVTYRIEAVSDLSVLIPISRITRPND